ncbi:MAG TPA: MEDS domain-containing protein [Xanthobacteraceae bacterium]|nr:MEDS domain-containing protein [Xanthobacteraceae bacterium]
MCQTELSISEDVRTQLVALGIPRARHTTDALASLFPREFNIKSTELSAEDLGRVLIRLVGEKVIPLPDTGAPLPIKKVEPGWHFCHFYQDYNHLLAIVAPYIAEGLKNGEGCFWVLPGAVTKQAACDALTPYVEDIDAYFASGQLEMLSHPDWYFDSSGRLKSFEEVSAALLFKQDRALARGFKFLRAAGDAGWVSGTEESKAFIDYEMKINAAIGATKIAAACTYRADVTADELVAIVTAHRDALYTAPSAKVRD